LGGKGFPFSIHIDSYNWFTPWRWLTRFGPWTGRQ
jgi:hypothetical protein